MKIFDKIIVVIAVIIMAVLGWNYYKAKKTSANNTGDDTGDTGNTDDILNNTRLAYYNDLYSRGSTGITAANEFKTKTTDSMSSTQIYNAYLAAYNKYFGTGTDTGGDTGGDTGNDPVYKPYQKNIAGTTFWCIMSSDGEMVYLKDRTGYQASTWIPVSVLTAYLYPNGDWEAAVPPGV